ncbi:hypothetical protein Q427_19625 [Halomonas sp. BC04]|nr:hypothetical protein Q427_19625 [Halomonas sp. BC04]
MTIPTAKAAINDIESFLTIYPRGGLAGKISLLVSPEQREIDRWLSAYGDLIDFIALDTLHFAPHRHLDAVRYIRQSIKRIGIISGNIVHSTDAQILIDEGVDVIRVGMSAASINRGEMMTGCGRSQLGAILDCASVCNRAGVPLISDGGIQTPADAFKALACGASAVMMGKVFAALEESGAEAVLYENAPHKIYHGMSRPGMIGDDMVPEGVEKLVPVSGTVRGFLSSWTKALRTSISRAGSSSIEELWKTATLEIKSAFSRECGASR